MNAPAEAADVLAVPKPIALVVQVWIHPGQQKAFLDFESQAAEIMATHGGRIERVIRPLEPMSETVPNEIHILTFPSSASWLNYRADPEILTLADQRAAAVSHTT